ncbi:hypothetical protein [Hymenobacter cellulosivorans]|uniref:Nuclear transport factor 2 family protein n=1 Tax=Hymenobacter cellulosivorans TaxID=2932249 RepID=A0ABY4F7A6_9BACT|nr:hypothetical protein [Hymenobacter cellulosivorans]UOQ52554.1 hypothetical protein MUN80_22730 [Hymenobacter cellulosivorans]
MKEYVWVAVLLVFLSCSRAFGQTPDSKEQEVVRAWYALLTQMETGPLSATKALMSETAFASLVGEAKTTEHAEKLRCWAEITRHSPLTLHLTGPTEAYLEVGRLDPEAGCYPSGFELHYQEGKWRLEGFYPSK